MKPVEINLPHKYKAREYQRPLWKAVFADGYKKIIAVWHRRSGKDVTLWNIIIRRAIENIGTHYYVLPNYAQAKRVIWEGITSDGTRFLEFIPKELIVGDPNDTEMKIKLINGSIIQLVGSEKFDSLRGTNGLTWVFSEYAFQNPNIWEVVKPIIKVNKGVAIFNSTPNGENHFKELREIAEKNPEEWFLEINTVINTQVITSAEIEQERKAGTPEHVINREYYCSFDEATEGSIYGDRLKDVVKENRISGGVWEKTAKVYTAWDIGYSDATAIVFYQVIGKEIRVVDYYENQGLTLADYVQTISKFPYDYADHTFPWDARIKPMSSGQSTKEVAEALGLKVRIAPSVSVQEGIDKVRSIFARLWFEKTKTEGLVRALKSYKRQWDNEKKSFRQNPVHDWSSHGADAFRYMALTIPEMKAVEDYKAIYSEYTNSDQQRVATFQEGYDIILTEQTHQDTL